MFLLQASIFGLLFCFVDAINIAIIINGSHVERIPKGSDVILNCSVPQGDGVDRLDWLKNNKPVTDNIVTESVGGRVLSSRLLLKNVYPANTTGIFACRSWKNKLLKNANQSLINVDEIPKLSIAPQLLFRYSGDNVELTCTATGGWPVPDLQWLDPSGNNITDENRIEVVSSKKLKLKLIDLKLKDDGKYYCRAINPVGQVRRDAIIVVKKLNAAQPPLIASPYEDYKYGYCGNNITLSFATEHTPRTTAFSRWFFGIKELQNSAKYIIQSEYSKEEGMFSLTVHNLTEQDAGNYTFEVTTTVRPGAVGYIYLRVTDPDLVETLPSLKTSPYREIDSYYGNSITLSFATEHTSKRTANFKWSFSDKSLQNSDKYTIQSEYSKEEGMFSLTVHNLTEQDAGNYTFEVTTTVRPGAVGYIYLRVTKPITYEINPIKTRVPLTASTAKLTCQVKYPNMDKQPKLYWSLNGTQLTPQSKYKTHLPEQNKAGHYTLIEMILTIYNYSESDCRWYTCGMNSSQGLKEKSIAPCLTNKTDSKGLDHEAYRQPTYVWISGTLASLYICIVIVIGVAFLVRSRKKSKNNPVFEGGLSASSLRLQLKCPETASDASCVLPSSI